MSVDWSADPAYIVRTRKRARESPTTDVYADAIHNKLLLKIKTNIAHPIFIPEITAEPATL